MSAVDPELFPACVAAGAEMVELGNFDCFYDQVNRTSKGSRLFCSVMHCTGYLFSCAVLSISTASECASSFSSRPFNMQR